MSSGYARRVRSTHGCFALALLAACSSKDADSAPAPCDGGCDDASEAADAPPEDTLPTCAPLDAGPATDPLYPAPRYRSASTTSAPATHACLVSAGFSPATDFADELFAEAGLPFVRAPDCTGCDPCFSFDSSSLDALAGPAKTVLTAAGDNPERYVVESTITGGHAHVAMHAYGEMGARFALRAALSFVRGGEDLRTFVDGTIADYPSFRVRGIVEGIYGPSGASALKAPWTPADRALAMRLAARLRENAYVYGPKDDRFARSNWRSPYPLDGDGQGQVIQMAAAEAERDGLAFTWSLSPCDSGPRFDFSKYDAELAVAIAKLESVRALGVKHFALFLDDTTNGCGTPEEHARLVNDLDDWSAKVSGGPLLFVGRKYDGTPDAYTDALGKLVHPAVQILWTGNEVEPATMTAADMKAIEGSLARQVAIWDNWPTTPCGFHGRSSDLSSVVSTFYSNPVLNEGSSAALPFASFAQVLGPIADYLWNADAYAASAAAEDGSYATWQRLLPTATTLAKACVPCGAATSFQCADAKTLGYCDPASGCFTTAPCGSGCIEGAPARCAP
jgi:hyaluronoglucosaminidase